MHDKVVIVTGAGFSVPAKLPVQNQILKEMIKPEPVSFLDVEPEFESRKFLRAFIKVGLFLLLNYAKGSYEFYVSEFERITERYFDSQAIERLALCLKKEHATIDQSCIDFTMGYLFDEQKYNLELYTLREKIRASLESESLDISLEDVFTSFDKSSQSKEFLQKYTYSQMDEIRHAIMRLFSYYFGKSIQGYQYDQPDYEKIIEFIKLNKERVSIVSTNWDTIVEGYFSRNSIPYDLCLNSDYYVFDDKRKNLRTAKGQVKLIKLHGSMNWFRCLGCSTLTIIEKNCFAKYLFDDNTEELCSACARTADAETNLLQPEIITPTMIKSINSQLYQNLWSAAGTELSKASNVCFIGYSLPIADYEFRYLLKKCIPASAKISVYLHSKDNPENVSFENKYLTDHLPQKRYSDLFSQNEIVFSYNGFKDFQFEV
jgi:NAD-dependent SIR2 family protein deacetylase